MVNASSGVIASVIYLKSMQEINCSGVKSVTNSHNGLFSALAQISHIALIIAAVAK